MKNVTKKESGFTIVEILVSILIFSLMATATVDLYVQTLAIQRRVYSAQLIQENAMSVFEIMAKEIRVGNVTSPNSSCTASTLNMTVYDSAGSLVNITYALNGEGIVTKQYGSTGTQYLSSRDVVFNRLLFCIQNSGLDNLPTRITILARLSTRTSPLLAAELQTTITSRDLAPELQN